MELKLNSYELALLVDLISEEIQVLKWVEVAEQEFLQETNALESIREDKNALQDLLGKLLVLE